MPRPASSSSFTGTSATEKMFGSKDALIFNRKPCNPQKAEMLSQINGLPRISIAWAPPEPLRYFCGFDVLIVSHLQHEHIKLAVKDFRSSILTRIVEILLSEQQRGFHFAAASLDCADSRNCSCVSRDSNQASKHEREPGSIRRKRKPIAEALFQPTSAFA